MALRLEDKKVIIDEVAVVANSAISAVAAEYRGLTVSEMDELRKSARNSGVYLRVVRNTLAKRALEGTRFSCMQPELTGPLLLAFAKEEPGSAARLLRDFCKDHQKLAVKVVSIDGKLLPANQLGAVADLPTKDEAISLLMSVMLAPVTKLVRTIAEPHAQVVRAVAAVGEKKKA